MTRPKRTMKKKRKVMLKTDNGLKHIGTGTYHHDSTGSYIRIFKDNAERESWGAWIRKRWNLEAQVVKAAKRWKKTWDAGNITQVGSGHKSIMPADKALCLAVGKLITLESHAKKKGVWV